MVITVLKTAPPPPPNAKTTGTPTRFVPPAKIPTKASFARKTVRQVITKLERSITLANLALAGNLTIYGISTNAYRGQNASVVSTSLPTARAPPTVCVAAVHRANTLPPPMHLPAQIGRIV